MKLALSTTFSAIDVEVFHNDLADAVSDIAHILTSLFDSLVRFVLVARALDLSRPRATLGGLHKARK